MQFDPTTTNLAQLVDHYNIECPENLDLNELDDQFSKWANLSPAEDEDREPVLLINRSQAEVEQWLRLEADQMTAEEYELEFGEPKNSVSEKELLSRWPKIPTAMVFDVISKAESLKNKVSDPLEAALTAKIRHELTDYDMLLLSMDKDEARGEINSQVRNIRLSFAGVTSEAGCL